MWTLTAMKTQYNANNLAEEIANLNNIASRTDDPYIESLIAQVFINVRQAPAALQLLNTVASQQDSNTGAVTGAATSITSSSGNNLLVETTALAMLAWMDYNPNTF